MRIVKPLRTILLTTAMTVPGECRTVTWYSDGAIIEQEVVAVKGVIDIPLPAQVINDSLRVKPLGGGSIRRVDIVPAAGSDPRGVEALQEQRSRLDDRLKALATREEIFKAAAKSQSGKAPRKTKTNPDPMQGIRQGTDFAIAQLEAVYTARRRTEQEIRRLDDRIAAARRERRTGQMTARILVSPLRGKVAVRYAVTGPGWTPRYDLHLEGSGSAQLSLSGLFDDSYAAFTQRASFAKMADRESAPLYPVASGTPERLARFQLPVSESRFGNGVQNTFSIGIRNPERFNLPAGDATLYRDGEYLGKFRFEGISSGKIRTVTGGK